MTDLRWNEEIERCNSYRWWLNRRRKRYLQSALMIIVLEIMVVLLVFGGEIIDYRIQDLIFGLFGLILFAAVAGYQVVQWVKSYSWKVHQAYRGIVVEKNRFSMHSKSKRHDNRGYYVVIRIGELTIEGRCEFEMYRKLEVGVEVLLFNIGTKEWFAISREEQY